MSELRWSGPIAFEGKDTVDHRYLYHRAVTWGDEPLPLIAISDQTIVGTIETVERNAGQLWGTGRYLRDDRKPGDRLGVGINLDVAKVDWKDDDEGDRMVLLAGRLTSAHVYDDDTATPAWPDAVITIEG